MVVLFLVIPRDYPLAPGMEMDIPLIIHARVLNRLIIPNKPRIFYIAWKNSLSNELILMCEPTLWVLDDRSHWTHPAEPLFPS